LYYNIILFIYKLYNNYPLLIIINNLYIYNLIIIYIYIYTKIISFYVFSNNYYIKTIFETIANFICYFTILIIHSWDKIYYINIKKNGDDPIYYFQLKETDVCVIHRILDCDCNIKVTKNNLNQFIEYYILLYNYSNFFKKNEKEKISEIDFSKNSMLKNDEC